MPEAQASYDEDQAALQAELDGKPDIHITIPQDPEVNPEVYKDVEPMLYRGFLTVSADINGVLFVFKSLNHHEFELLRFSAGERSSNAFWNSFLAQAVFMVDGHNILSDREKWTPKLADLFAGLPKDARAKIIRYVSEVNRRSSSAVVLTEAYAMELASRYRWMQLKGLDLTSIAVTGIDGTQRLGLNWAQQLWLALNHADDRNELHEREWENSKFVASCFAGKGIQKVYNQDNERRRKDKEERSSRKDRVLREIILGEVSDSRTLKIPGAVITAPKTVEELAHQLENDLRGNKDWHDKVINAHETNIRQRSNERRVQLEEVARESAVQFGDQSIIGGSDLRGLSLQEMEKQMASRKQLQAQRAARMQVHPEDTDEKTQQFLEKWGMTEVGSHVSTTDRDISEAVSLPKLDRVPTVPFRKR